MRAFVLLATLVQVPTDAPSALKPLSSWSVDHAGNRCVAARRYGSAEAPLTVGLEFGLLTNGILLFVVGNRSQVGSPGSVLVTLRTPGQVAAERIAGTRRDLAKGGAMLMDFPLSAANLDPLVGAPSVTIESTGGPPIVFALSMTRSLIDAVQKCMVETLVSYGFDPVKVATVAKPAESIDPAAWVTHDDYPAGAITAGKTGRTWFGWKITADGRIVDCRTLESSGSAELDRASCEAVTRRGRYRRPALDAAGQPVESYAIRFSDWSLPR